LGLVIYNDLHLVPDHHRHHHGEPVISGPCLLPSQNIDVTSAPDDFPTTATFATSDQQIHIRVSGTDIRPKEVVLVSLALLLLVLNSNKIHLYKFILANHVYCCHLRYVYASGLNKRLKQCFAFSYLELDS
jgi:hypothetical protein